MYNTPHILVMPGDGIGPEITDAAVYVLKAVADLYRMDLTITEFEVGESLYQREGRYLSEEAMGICNELARNGRGAILFGAVQSEPIGLLRYECDLFANIRPFKMLDSMVSASRLRPEYVHGTDMLIVRELVSGLYYGEEDSGVGGGGRWASQLMRYGEAQVRRIVRVGLERAMSRRQKLTYVHKENAIPKVFELWASVLAEETAHFPDVEVDDLLVDNMAMQLVLRPRDFDVLLCPNLFGDILSDVAAGVIGSIGVCPSASLNANGFGLYESIGGCAPDIAGQGIANPISTILSVALMCEISLNHEQAARSIEDACARILRGYRTPDIWEKSTERVGTSEMGQLIAAELKHGSMDSHDG